MAFDGIFLNGICSELNDSLANGKVDKIYQIDGHNIVIVIRCQGANHQLLLSSHPNMGRVHITEERRTNPTEPPVFCMVLRKHLIGGRIVSITQPQLERIMEIHFDTYNELGDRESKVLVCEIMGKHSNIILLDSNKTIIDSIKRVNHNISSYREVLPGRTYVMPPAQEKLQLTVIDETTVANIIVNSPENTKLNKLLVANIQGISPLLASELVFRCGLSLETTVNTCGIREIQLLTSTLNSLAKTVEQSSFTPCIAYEKKQPIAFSSIQLTHFVNAHISSEATLNKTADTFFLLKEKKDLLTQEKGNIKQKLRHEIVKLTDKLAIQKKELQTAKNSLQDKIKGQLITANIYQIKPGQSSIEVVNYFLADTPTITIELDPAISAAENAQKHFRRYNKSKKTIEYLSEQIGLGQDELNYLESIYTNLEQSLTLDDIEEIKRELIQTNYLTPPKQEKSKKIKTEKPKPYEFISSDGFTILVGKNNNQNDWLTLKNSQEHDIWLHTKNIPGSHVIIKSENRQVPDNTIYQGALLAAHFSKARLSLKVPVDFTLVKYVKKPNGAKPGMVIYSNEQTIYANADDPWLKALELD